MMMTMMTLTIMIKKTDMHKGDRVMLLSGQEGEIMECLDSTLKTYRIRVVKSKEIVYFDESKLKLKRRHFLNVLLGRG